MQKQKLLFLSQNAIFDMGKKSGKEVVFRTLEGLSLHFEIDIIAPGEPLNINNGRFFLLTSKWFNKLKSIKYVGHLFNYFYVFILLLQVRKIINSNNLCPDVVYLAGPWMSFIGQRLFKNKSILINRYYGVAWNPQTHHSLKNRLRFLMKNLGYKKFGDLVIMTNDGTQGDEFLRRINCPENKMRFWRNGVNFPKMPVNRIEIKNQFYKKHGITNDKKLVVSVSRLAAWKRVDVSIRAFASLLETESNAVLFIVGDGEEREKLELLAKELNIQESIIFAGSIPGDKLSEIYFSADLFISFYNYSNAGNPLFEAMMHACCIVTLNSEGMSSFLPSGSGVLLNSNLPDIIAKELTSLLINDERRILLGKNAQKTAEQDFPTWEARIQLEIDEIVRLTKSKS